MNSLAVSWEQSTALSCFETWRAELKTASAMGVVPTYELSLKPVLIVVQSLSGNMYAEMTKAELTTATISGNTRFDRTDCTSVFNDLLSLATTVLSVEAKSEDMASGSSRKRKVNALAVAITSPVKGTREAKVHHAVNVTMTKEHSASRPEAEAIVNALVHEEANMSDITPWVEACMLTLGSNKKLTEPEVRIAAKQLHSQKGAEAKGGRRSNKGKGKGKGKGGEGRSHGRGGGSSSTGGQGNNNPTKVVTCQTKGCNETVGWNRNESKYFQHCQGCARASPTRKVNANKAGVSFNVVLPNGGTESVMIDANQARLLNLAQSGAQFTMASDADEDHLTKFEKNNSSQ